MPTVEEVYHQAWGKVGGVGRLRRTFSLFAEFWRNARASGQEQDPGQRRDSGNCKRMYTQTRDSTTARSVGAKT